MEGWRERERMKERERATDRQAGMQRDDVHTVVLCSVNIFKHLIFLLHVGLVLCAEQQRIQLRVTIA